MNLFSPQLFAQTRDGIWSQPNGSGALWIGILVTLVVSFGLMFAMMAAPARLRRPIIAVFTFVAGAFYVLFWLWPKPQGREAGDIPAGAVESVGFWLEDAVGRFANLSNILTSFLLGLGVFSLTRLHLTRLVKQQKDWFFSLILFISMLSMVGVGYWEWYTSSFISPDVDFGTPANWVTATYAKDFLFDGLLQKMDAAMFSIIAFYILSAAYRAFRIRSVEATILLATALIVMLSLLALVELYWGMAIDGMGGTDPQAFANNFNLSEIRGFIGKAFQQPGIRAIDFGIGVGALAMGLRLWLSLEKGGMSA